MIKQATQQETQEEELTLEASFERIDEILEMLESRDITLEESFQRYQQGMDLLKQCNEKIDRVEKKMKLMNEEGELVDFY